MNNFGLDPGFSIVVVQGTLFFTIGVAMMLLSILATLAVLAIARHRRRLTMQALPPEPAFIHEIYTDDSRFAIQGQNWEWISDLPSTMGCPRCGQWVDLGMRLYKNIPDGMTYTLTRHECTANTAALDTTPIPAWKRGEI